MTKLHAVALELLVEARLELGEAAMVVPDLEAMVAESRCARRWRLLALALYRARRQADALSALRRARTTLADELGVDPGPALRELEAEVLERSPALDRSPAGGAAFHPGLPAAGTTCSTGTTSWPRSAPRARRPGRRGTRARSSRTRRDRQDAVADRGRRLAAERSVRVLTARGSQLEQSFGFGAARRLFEPELITDEHRSRVVRWGGGRRRGVFDRPGESASRAGRGSFAVLHGLYWLAVNLTGSGPLLLAVDDVEWCDSASLRYLAYLVRRLEAVPVLVVGTVRTGEQHEDEALLAELRWTRSAQVCGRNRCRRRPPPASSPGGWAAGLPAVHPRLPADHRGNPLLLRQLFARWSPTGCGRTPPPTWWWRSARGRSPAWC